MLLLDGATIQARIEQARRSTLQGLDSLQQPQAPMGVSRISTHHDASLWPGMLLPGTYNAVMCRALLGELVTWTANERSALSLWLASYQRPDGVFRVPGMSDTTVFKKPDLEETWRYIDFHVTNYSLGAMEMLEPSRAPVLTFIRPWLEPLFLKAWLADRDLRDPWQEGNNIVNLGSFLLLCADHGTASDRARVDDCLHILFEWHDRLQEPATGFWGVGQASDPVRALHAMAGSMHNFHLWYRCGRPLPYQERAVDWALERPPAIDSACIDVDLVDLLVHAHDLIDYRRADIRRWLSQLLPRLLDLQLSDGGFPDVQTGIRRQDGWIGGYEEPQGLSNTFSTWFRWIAIAMIADLLWPGRWSWAFRRMVGIGYRKPRAI